MPQNALVLKNIMELNVKKQKSAEYLYRNIILLLQSLVLAIIGTLFIRRVALNLSIADWMFLLALKNTRRTNEAKKMRIRCGIALCVVLA